jgi:predicted transcriptional regulator
MNKPEVCEHGRLKRQCNECDLQSQLAEVTAERDTLQFNFNKLIAEEDRLKAELEKVVDECVKKELVLVTLKQKAERLAEVLKDIASHCCHPM